MKALGNDFAFPEAGQELSPGYDGYFPDKTFRLFIADNEGFVWWKGFHKGLHRFQVFIIYMVFPYCSNQPLDPLNVFNINML